MNAEPPPPVALVKVYTVPVFCPAVNICMTMTTLPPRVVFMLLPASTVYTTFVGFRLLPLVVMMIWVLSALKAQVKNAGSRFTVNCTSESEPETSPLIASIAVFGETLNRTEVSRPLELPACKELRGMVWWVRSCECSRIPWKCKDLQQLNERVWFTRQCLDPIVPARAVRCVYSVLTLRCSPSVALR